MMDDASVISRTRSLSTGTYGRLGRAVSVLTKKRKSSSPLPITLASEGNQTPKVKRGLSLNVSQLVRRLDRTSVTPTSSTTLPLPLASSPQTFSTPPADQLSDAGVLSSSPNEVPVMLSSPREEIFRHRGYFNASQPSLVTSSSQSYTMRRQLSAAPNASIRRTVHGLFRKRESGKNSPIASDTRLDMATETIGINNEKMSFDSVSRFSLTSSKTCISMTVAGYEMSGYTKESNKQKKLVRVRRRNEHHQAITRAILAREGTPRGLDIDTLLGVQSLSVERSPFPGLVSSDYASVIDSKADSVLTTEGWSVITTAAEQTTTDEATMAASGIAPNKTDKLVKVVEESTDDNSSVAAPILSTVYTTEENNADGDSPLPSGTDTSAEESAVDTYDATDSALPPSPPLPSTVSDGVSLKEPVDPPTNESVEEENNKDDSDEKVAPPIPSRRKKILSITRSPSGRLRLSPVAASPCRALCAVSASITGQAVADQQRRQARRGSEGSSSSNTSSDNSRVEEDIVTTEDDKQPLSYSDQSAEEKEEEKVKEEEEQEQEVIVVKEDAFVSLDMTEGRRMERPFGTFNCSELLRSLVQRGTVPVA